MTSFGHLYHFFWEFGEFEELGELEDSDGDLARQSTFLKEGPADPDALPRNTATVLRSESCSDDASRPTSHVGRASHVMRLWSTFARRGLRKSTESVGESNIA